MKFDPKDSATWTWVTLNAWLMAATRTPFELRAALKVEARTHRRLVYLLRLQSRLSRLEAKAAKRDLMGYKK